MTQATLDSQLGVLVAMTKSEMIHAYLVGATRQVDNTYAAAQNTYDAPKGNQLDFHLQGAMAEKVVAKHYGVYWSGALGDYKAKDVAGAQVRGTPLPDGCLIVHAEASDDPADPFILVCGTGPRFWIRGWLFGHEAKQRRFWRDRGVRYPAYFVPQDELHPIHTLQLPWRRA